MTELWNGNRNLLCDGGAGGNGSVSSVAVPLTRLTGMSSSGTVLLSHGDEDSRAWFAEQIRERYPRLRILEPKPCESVEA